MDIDQESHHPTTSATQPTEPKPLLETVEIDGELVASATTTMTRPSESQYKLLVAGFLLYSLIVGYYAGTRPNGKFRSPFSYHPFLMTCGMVGCFGIASVTKKLGGYVNTKNHALLAMLGQLLTFGGFYAIYHNKNLMERPHFTSLHGKMGLALVISSAGAGMAGAVFLHPDVGIDKTNQTIRFAHKTLSRVVLGLAWGTAFYGMYAMTQDALELAMFGLPLVVFAPFTLV